jgi:hypothetical protein
MSLILAGGYKYRQVHWPDACRVREAPAVLAWLQRGVDLAIVS